MSEIYPPDGENRKYLTERDKRASGSRRACKEKEEKQKDKPEILVPVFENAPEQVSLSAINEKRLNIIEAVSDSAKKGIRRSGLEIKKAQELEEKKKQQQEKEWEIPAFLRRVKFKS